MSACFLKKNPGYAVLRSQPCVNIATQDNCARDPARQDDLQDWLRICYKYKKAKLLGEYVALTEKLYVTWVVESELLRNL